MQQLIAPPDNSPHNRLDITRGGLLVGPGTETSDDISAAAHGQVFVLNAETVKIVGADRLDALLTIITEHHTNLSVSAGEYIIPERAIRFMSEQFWFYLNDAGLVARKNGTPDPAHAAGIAQVVDDAINAARVFVKLSAGELQTCPT